MAKSTINRRKTPIKRKSNKTGNSRRSNTSKIGDDKDNIANSKALDASNDPSWYAANTQMLKDVASYSFFNPLGRDLEGLDPQAGIFTLNWSPAFGESNSDPNSAINIAARLFYSWVRHANSGHANYESPDLMMYIMAMDSVYSFHASLVRCYGLLSTYSYANRYIPKSLIMALGFDFDDMLSNMANLRYFINASAVKMSSMAVPATFTYYQRHIWMNSNVYLDEASIKGQIYAFRQIKALQFSPRTSQRGSELTIYPLSSSTPNGLLKFSDVVRIMNTLLDAIVSDEDCNIMSGDILKAYGSENIMKFGPIPEDYAIVPVINPEVLLQMHNATAVGLIQEYSVTQNSGNIVVSMRQNQALVLHERHGWNYLYMDAFTDSPTPDEVMVGTRLMSAPYIQDGNVVNSILCGSEIVEAFTIHSMVNGALESDMITSVYERNLDTAGDMDIYLTPLLRITQFNKAPFVALRTTSGYVGEWIGSTNNVTTMDRNELKKLHDTALLSMLDVTHVAYAGASAK